MQFHQAGPTARFRSRRECPRPTTERSPLDLARLTAGQPHARSKSWGRHSASRCTEDFARLIRLSEEQGWRLIVTELGIDSRAPMGKAMAHMAVVFAELERDFIRMRTREALQVKRENGVTLGRPRSTPDDVVARIVRTWWPALCGSARRARPHTRLPAI
jgi:hypothetical protein